MGEFLPKDWRDRVTIDPQNEELDRVEEALFLSAKSGSLLEPEMTPQQWRQFCEAATLEEDERRAKLPEKLSRLTKKQRELLQTAGESVRSSGARKMIAKRDKLIKSLRPQCIDPNDEAFEREILEDLGLTEEEFKSVDKSLGPLADWDKLEKLNEMNYESP